MYACGLPDRPSPDHPRPPMRRGHCSSLSPGWRDRSRRSRIRSVTTCTRAPIACERGLGGEPHLNDPLHRVRLIQHELKLVPGFGYTINAMTACRC